jgi:glutamyl-tRNA synthetase
VRVEDLDRANATPELAAQQLDDLAALGIDWDGPVVVQSSRFDEHLATVEQLSAAGRTYRCWCTRREIREALAAPHGAVDRYPGTCRTLDTAAVRQRERSGRPAAIRLLSNDEPVEFHDAVLGRRCGAADDVVLVRNDGIPAYQLAVVVDDAAAGITQVLRGDDLAESTFSQILLHRLLGLETPCYAHVPLMLNQHGERLAKRDGAVSLDAIDLEPTEIARRLWASLGQTGTPAATDFDLIAVPHTAVTYDPAAWPVRTAPATGRT